MAAAAEKPKAKVVKLSRTLLGHLDLIRKGRESYDALLRRHFGLPNKRKEAQPLRTYYVIDTEKDLIVLRTKAEAAGEAILLAVKKGQKFTHKQRKPDVITVRELP